MNAVEGIWIRATVWVCPIVGHCHSGRIILLWPYRNGTCIDIDTVTMAVSRGDAVVARFDTEGVTWSIVIQEQCAPFSYAYQFLPRAIFLS